jgi:hypothetical protein
MHIAKIMLTMLNETKVPYYFWVETRMLIVYIMNKTPTCNNSWHDAKGKTHRQKLVVPHFKIFSCIAHVNVLNGRRTKINPKVTKCIFNGFFWNNRGLSLISCKRVKMFLMRWIINIHKWNNKMKRLKMVTFHQM